jgi:ABC-type lipoprotein release transport system permease subunit
MEMSDTIIVALIGLLGSGLGSLIGVIASSKLTQYRIQKLEEQVAKHNNMVERTYKLEGRMDEAEHDIRDLKARVIQ